MFEGHSIFVHVSGYPCASLPPGLRRRSSPWSGLSSPRWRGRSGGRANKKCLPTYLPRSLSLTLPVFSHPITRKSHTFFLSHPFLPSFHLGRIGDSAKNRLLFLLSSSPSCRVLPALSRAKLALINPTKVDRLKTLRLENKRIRQHLKNVQLKFSSNIWVFKEFR